MNYRTLLEALRREEASRRLASESLKVCPLCGAVNALMSSECFVCRWHGDFCYDPMEIEDGVVEMLSRCPELVDALIPWEQPKRSLWDRIRTWFHRRQIKKKLDLWA